MKKHDMKKEEELKNQQPQEPSTAPEESPVEAGPDDLNKIVQDLQEERNQLFQKLQRSVADLQNYQKKAIRDRQESVQRAELGAIERFVFPLIEDLDRALKSATDHGYSKDDPLVQGVNLVLQHSFGQLRQLNIESIEAEGKTFDPMFHEAMMELPTEGVAENTIVQVVSRGYMQDGKTIRPARVVVAKTPKTPAPTETQVQNDGELEKE
jgi:molecular chaperone GrpE